MSATDTKQFFTADQARKLREEDQFSPNELTSELPRRRAEAEAKAKLDVQSYFERHVARSLQSSARTSSVLVHKIEGSFHNENARALARELAAYLHGLGFHAAY